MLDYYFYEVLFLVDSEILETQRKELDIQAQCESMKPCVHSGVV